MRTMAEHPLGRGVRARAVPVNHSEFELGRYEVFVAVRSVRAACDRIADAISQAGRPDSGEWRSRFAMMPDPDHREVFDDTSITPARDGILINSLASKVEPIARMAESSETRS